MRDCHCHWRYPPRLARYRLGGKTHSIFEVDCFLYGCSASVENKLKTGQHSLRAQRFVSKVERGTWEQKLHAFEAHMLANTSVERAKAVTERLIIPTSAAFTWTFRECVSADFTGLGAPAAGAIPAGTAYVKFDVAVNPAPVFAATPWPVPPPTSKAGVLIQLLMDPANPANIHPNYTDVNIVTFQTMYQAVPDQTPIIGINYSAEDRFSAEGWDKWLERKYLHAVFK